MKTGVLLIHGFTSHRSSLEALLPELDRCGLEWRYPILAGHGSQPKDLSDRRWHHWQADVERGYQELRQTHDRVVIIALSMGTLLALELAIGHPDHVAGLVLLSPAVKFKNPFAPLTPVIAPIIPRMRFPATDRYSAKQYAQKDRGYPWFPTAPFHSYWKRTRAILGEVRTVRCPVRIIQSRVDKVADPRGAQALYDALPGKKALFWHEVSGHEMLLDAETADVLQEILGFPPLAST